MAIRPTNAITLVSLFTHMSTVSHYILSSLYNEEFVRDGDEFFATAIEWADEKGDTVLSDDDSLEAVQAIGTLYAATLIRAIEGDVPEPEGAVLEALNTVDIISQSITT